MNLTRVKGVMMRHAFETRRNVDRIVDMLYWPILDVVLWGFITIYLDRFAQPGVVSFLLGAAILWGIFYGFQRDMAVGFIDEIWSRNLINLFSTPLTVAEYMTGLIAVNVIKVMVAFCATATLAWACYAFNIAPFIPVLLPYMAVLMLFALALGIVITGLIFRYSTRLQTLAWSFAGLLGPVSCVMYPLSALPRFLRPVALTLPTTYAFEGMRQALSGGGFSRYRFGVALTLDGAYLVAALVGFRVLFEQARNRGLLVKFE
jgi:ABC-2 type transport system permease protein